MKPPFRLPAEDPSKTSQIVDGFAPGGEPIVSVLFGRTFHVGRDGACSPGDFEIAKELRYEKAQVSTQFTRPSLLVRDVDLYPWRNLTDVVVRGTVRSEKPVEQLDVSLQVLGATTKIELDLVVTGDRGVEQGPTGPRLSAPARFTEMPLRYDRAYGGTDELAEMKNLGPELLNYFVKQVDPEENEEISIYSYPRNPAGKGYVVDEESVLGLSWPNVEFRKDRLRLTDLVKPLDRWGERPYPACFDWFPHAWFPRFAFFDEYMPTHDGRVPRAERELGVFGPDFDDKPVEKRPKHPFANGAHPYLCRNRLTGDEALRVSHLSRDGRDFGVRLPGLEPTVSIRLLNDPRVKLPAALDLVLVEAELEQVTLLWRATLFPQRQHLPLYWIEQSEYQIHW